MREKPKKGAGTRDPNLKKNLPSGRYYGRLVITGKQKWVDLHTGSLAVARLRLEDERARTGGLRREAAGTVAGLIAVYRRRVNERSNIAEKTRIGALGALETVVRTWPRFGSLAPTEVTRRAVIDWCNRIAREGTGSLPPGARGPSAKYTGRSYSTINHAVDALRQLLDIAVEEGLVPANPLLGKGLKVRRRPHKPRLPEPSVISAVFAEIERNGGSPPRSRGAADLCRFLAYTGCRLGEAKLVTWADVDFARGLLHVRGTKTSAAHREVPMIPAARQLLERLRGASGGETGARVVPVVEAGISLASACRRLGVEPLTHHDLRDAFATLAIEAGVDVPTVAAWLGHADGGALLMKTYAHHRRAHSLAQAAKVTF
jgi:integrase